MPDGSHSSMPASAGDKALDRTIAALAELASAEIHQLDSLISVAAEALRNQDTGIDAAVADVIEENAWARLNEARKSIEAIRRECDRGMARKAREVSHA